ncbi:MAG: hypothetical protein ABI707_11920, partial [Ferruginibacter sp.]
EWTSVFVDDPQGEKRKLLPVRVAICDPPGLLKPIVYCDLVGLNSSEAKEKLLGAASNERIKPNTSPAFPGLAIIEKNALAVPGHSNLSVAKQLLDILRTTFTTFVSQAKIRNQLEKLIVSRLHIKGKLQYEDFFFKYYNDMNAEERSLHSIMRSYTSDILSEYNRNSLSLIEEHPSLKKEITRLKELEGHLIVWLNKYERVFKITPSLPLLYVGVLENVPFPKGIEDDLEVYIHKTLLI